ncbi:hypothetical protein OUZ56_018609 [Daphnia magna]|uniref:Uncharacterized protein n=1 Tax=Daphnia magna TaxID=35525 RepID=A0ABQ9Z9D2_9CRUS|nr:hypothetical protein OUZ56_018609 [Daphnia magna]
MSTAYTRLLYCTPRRTRWSTQMVYQLTIIEADMEGKEDVQGVDGDDDKPQLELDFGAFRRSSSALLRRRLSSKPHPTLQEEIMTTLETGCIALSRWQDNYPLSDVIKEKHQWFRESGPK